MKVFSSIKKLFKKKIKAQKEYTTSSEVSFKDSTGKKIELEIKANGNTTLLIIKEKELNFVLDKECVSLLIILLQSYVQYETFPDLNED